MIEYNYLLSIYLVLINIWDVNLYLIQRHYDSNTKYKNSPKYSNHMRTNNPTQKATPHCSSLASYTKYKQFKHELLLKMSRQDPLSILQSGIFEQYESAVFAPQIGQNWGGDQFMYRMGSKIVGYDVGGVQVKIVERRSHSCDKNNSYNNNKRTGISCTGCAGLQNRIRMMQQQAHVDLMIWSNIMHNHFRINQPNRSNQCNSSSIIDSDKQNNMNSTNIPRIDASEDAENISKLIKQKYKQINNQSWNLMSQSTLLQQSQSIINSIVYKILQNPTSKNIKFILKQLFTQIEQQQQKTISELNRLQKQSSKLLKITQQNSTNQLQYIVKVKHLQKIIQEKDREIKELEERCRMCQENGKDRENQLRKIIRGKYREIQSMQQETNKTGIQGLRQRIAIDSLRRTTLCSLNKEIFEFELKMEDLGIQFAANSRRTGQQEPQEQSTQQTRCDQ